jgi:sulfur relay (sulfurtransferase) DsrF/TusC family protein
MTGAADIVVLIQTDPEASHKPVEGIRVALGLVSGEHRVKVVLTGKAVLLLGADAEDLVDGELLPKYLPSLAGLIGTLYVDENGFKEAGLDGTEYHVTALSASGIGELIRKAERVVVF